MVASKADWNVMNALHLWIFISYLSAAEGSPILVPVKFLPNRGVKLFLLAWLYSSSSEVWREISNLQRVLGQAPQIRVNSYGGWRISIWTLVCSNRTGFFVQICIKMQWQFSPCFLLFAILGAQFWKLLREIPKMLSIFLFYLYIYLKNIKGSCSWVETDTSCLFKIEVFPIPNFPFSVKRNPKFLMRDCQAEILSNCGNWRIQICLYRRYFHGHYVTAILSLMTRIPQMVSPKSPAEVLARICYTTVFKNIKK